MNQYLKFSLGIIIFGLLLSILYKVNESPAVKEIVVYKDRLVPTPLAKHTLFIKCLEHRRPLTGINNKVHMTDDTLEGNPIYGGVDGKDIEDCKKAAIELTEYPKLK